MGGDADEGDRRALFEHVCLGEDGAAVVDEQEEDGVGEPGDPYPRPLPIRTRPLLLREDETDDGFPYHRRDVESYPPSENEVPDDYPPAHNRGDQTNLSHDLPQSEQQPSTPLFGASDSTAQPSSELSTGPFYSYDDRVALERTLLAFRNKHARPRPKTTLTTWRIVARNTTQKHRGQEAQAIAFDKFITLRESILYWSHVAEATRRERVAAQGPLMDPAKEAKTFARAAKAYNLLLMFKALTHWQVCAKEELERTAIARRHILRKRYFTTWREHQIDVESEIFTFRLRTLLGTWLRASIHQTVCAEVAVQTYRHGLVKSAFDTWQDEFRGRLADELRTCRLKEQCVAVWQVKIRLDDELYNRAVFHDEATLLGHAVSKWRRAAADVRMMAYRCMGQMVNKDRQRSIEDWRSIAVITEKLREYTKERERQSMSGSIDHWSMKVDDVKHMAVLAKRADCLDWLTHWNNENKLKQFEGRSIRQLKTEVLTQWSLEQKLASFKRLFGRRLKLSVLAQLHAAADELRNKTAQGEQAADRFFEGDTKATMILMWRHKTNVVLEEEDTAATMQFRHTANSCLEVWYSRMDEEAVRIAELEAFADRGAYYSSVYNTLTEWSEVADRIRRERLTRTYHSFRRQCKLNLATDCLLTWRAETYAAFTAESEADHVYANHLMDEVANCLQHWQQKTTTVQAVQEVAKGAELEVWWGRWTSRVTGLQEAELDAADYANEQTLSRCWRSWEFALWQNKGRQHTVDALLEKNNRKLCRQVIGVWRQKAFPDGTYHDLRSSVASRRSMRYGSVRTLETPRFGNAINARSSQASFQQSGQIQGDLDKEEIYAATPQRKSGRASEPPRNPFSGPKDLYRSLPHRPRGYSKYDPPSVAPTPVAAGPAPSHLSSSVYMSAQQQRSQTPYFKQPTFTAVVAEQQEAAFPEFDEDEISFAPSEGNEDYPGTFMSTPTRWTGTRTTVVDPSSRQSAPYRRPAPVVSTTTPSTVLDTPYERALRREYAGGLALSRSSAVGGTGRSAATPKVTFADIREESGEGIFDEE